MTQILRWVSSIDKVSCVNKGVLRNVYDTPARAWSLFVVVALLALAACSPGEDGQPESAPGAGTEQTDEATDAATEDDPGGDDGATAEPTGDVADIEERNFRVQSTSPPEDLWTQALDVFKTELEDRSGGRLTVEVFCCGELASNTVEEIESIAQGDLDASFIAGGVVPNFDETAAVFQLPFIAEDAEGYHRLLDSPAGQAVWVDILGPMGIHVIPEAASNQGFRQLTNSVRPIRAPEDLSGLRIRMSDTPIWRDVMTTLGADPITMPFGDLPGALQQGVVDGQENPLSLIDSASLYDFQDHVTVWNYAGSPIVFGINQALFDSLEPAAQEMVTESAIAAAMWHREEYQAVDARLVDELQDEFESIDELSSEELQAFREAMQPVYEDWSERLGPDLVEEFQDIAGQ